MIHKLLLALSGVIVEPECRTCRQPIERDDEFGQSERVCLPCRR
jgi:hypothetical protein